MPTLYCYQLRKVVLSNSLQASWCFFRTRLPGMLCASAILRADASLTIANSYMSARASSHMTKGLRCCESCRCGNTAKNWQRWLQAQRISRVSHTFIRCLQDRWFFMSSLAWNLLPKKCEEKLWIPANHPGPGLNIPRCKDFHQRGGCKRPAGKCHFWHLTDATVARWAPWVQWWDAPLGPLLGFSVCSLRECRECTKVKVALQVLPPGFHHFACIFICIVLKPWLTGHSYMDSRLDSTSGATPARRLVLIPLHLISTSPTLGYLEMFFWSWTWHCWASFKRTDWYVNNQRLYKQQDRKIPN